MKISKSFKVYIHILLAFFLIMSHLLASQELHENLIIHKKPVTLKNIKFKDFNLSDIDLDQNKGKIMILNFWATWCAPCKKEMPSLSRLATQFPRLMIYPINMEKPNQSKTKLFFEELKIINLDIFFDPDFTLAKTFRMRGLPTSIILDKNGNEIARVVGEI